MITRESVANPLSERTTTIFFSFIGLELAGITSLESARAPKIRQQRLAEHR